MRLAYNIVSFKTFHF